MPLFRITLRKSLGCMLLVAGFALSSIAQAAAHAEATLLIEADSGKVLEAENATFPWHPASLTKLMTTYVTLKAVKEGRLSLDKVLTVSPTAAAQSPSKMGFRPGVQVTVDNALKMMMVKSANDMAVVLAEGVGGSIDGFSAMMNQTAQQLGMTQSNFVNPNGLPDDRQITSARDMAILSRAIIRDLPEYEYFVHIPSIRYGRRVTPNFNKLIGRYPGADGMKTGFICASGFNLIASATQNGRRLIAVVLGASSSQMRSIKAIKLLDRGFNSNNLTWLRPALGTVDHLVPIDAAPPDLRDEVCGPKRKRPASDDPGEDIIASTTSDNPALAFFSTGVKPPVLRPEDMLAAAAAPSEPVVVYTGPTKTGADLIAAVAADTASQTPPRSKKTRTAKGKHGAKTQAADAKTDAKSEARITVMVDTKDKKKGTKTAHASDKPAAAPKPAAKPAAADKKSASRPAEAARKPAPAKQGASSDTKPKAASTAKN